MTTPPWTTTWNDEFQPAFWLAKHAMTRASDAMFRRHGIRQGQQYVLMCLWHRDRRTPGELAAEIGVSTPTVTRTTARMESSGLLRREPHPSDGRLVYVCLTDAGKRLRGTLDEAVCQLSDTALTGLSRQQREQLTSMLRQVRLNLTRAAG